ncbi:MAG TPA: SRPBCC domain-containing protein [Actinomycetes bacterium]|nr:SRPBCC domain-containing protein [Actinomycetes bacterium]
MAAPEHRNQTPPGAPRTRRVAGRRAGEEETEMKAYEASSTIAASPEDIWAILVDGPGYTRWDNGVVRVEGRIAPGEKLKVVSEANPGRTFPVKVTEFTPGRRLAWSGGMPLGLFKGVRTFTLTPQGGVTAFQVREVYTGPLLPMIWRTIPDLGPSFNKFATGLKDRAEHGPGA